MSLQHTLCKPITVTGNGLHTGALVKVQLLPATENTGLLISNGIDQMRLSPEIVSGEVRGTQLRYKSIDIYTIEHLLSALNGLGVDNVEIIIDGPELPILDGSAKIWCAKILEAGLQTQSVDQDIFTVTQPVRVEHKDSFVIAFPADQLRITYAVEYPYIGQQLFDASINPEQYVNQIASARTFCMDFEIAKQQELGLIKGGSLECAIVYSPDGPSSTLRMPNEAVLHKTLDFLGDLYTIGKRVQGHFVLYKSSHALNIRLVEALKIAGDR